MAYPRPAATPSDGVPRGSGGGTTLARTAAELSAVSTSDDHLFLPIRETLRRGTLVADRAFDEVYPGAVRRASYHHWTPVEVAVRAAKLLADRPGARVLDVGSGVGKFCIVAAASVNARVRGIEHRPHLVEIARRAAARVGVDVAFEHRVLSADDADDVDGVYLFNPFGENLCAAEDRIDATVELSEARYRRDLGTLDAFLRAARVGTRVVTYCGTGATLPPDYDLVARERCTGRLELWVKAACSAA